MALEPVTITLEEPANEELADMTRRFLWQLKEEEETRRLLEGKEAIQNIQAQRRSGSATRRCAHQKTDEIFENRTPEPGVTGLANRIRHRPEEEEPR